MMGGQIGKNATRNDWFAVSWWQNCKENVVRDTYNENSNIKIDQSRVKRKSLFYFEIALSFVSVWWEQNKVAEVSTAK